MAPMLPLMSNPSTKSGKFPTILFISSSAITITILFCSLGMLLLRSYTPIIQLNNLAVSDLKVSNSNLVAIWLANLTMYNPNPALSVKMNSVEASIVYKHDNALCFTSVDDFELGFGEKKDVYLKFVTTGEESNQPIVEYPLLKEIEKVWRQGKISFKIRIKAMTWYEIDLPGRRRKTVIMNPYTMDLDVNVGDGRESIARSNIIVGDALKEDGPLLKMVTD